MNFADEFRVNAAPSDVSAFLCDMNRFAPLLPTYVSHRPVGYGVTDVIVAVGLGRLRGHANVRLRLTQDGARARYAGAGRAFGGRFDLHANFLVRPDGLDATIVIWDGSLNVLGRLSMLAGQLLRPIAVRHIDQLVVGVRETLSPGSS
jgi:carbon monoxide dehydrogenase subunit G